jgi:hypothetical protein
MRRLAVFLIVATFLVGDLHPTYADETSPADKTAELEKSLKKTSDLLAAERAKVADLTKKIGDIDIWLSKERALGGKYMAKIGEMDVLLSAARKKYFDLLAFAPGLAGAVKLSESGLPSMDKAKAYDPVGDYMGIGDDVFKDGPSMKMDSAGIPTVKYGDKFYYNPVTVAQYALAEYCRPSGVSSKFIPAADYLAGMMGPDGAFRYQFEFERYATGEMYHPGWISGMAQGQAISVFVRAYHLTKQHKYLDAARKALDFMLLPADKGGPMTTLERFPPEPSKLPFIMEYPQSPPVYTLNGYMFSMLGLYDYAAVSKDKKTKRVAARLLVTLKTLLPYYDMGSFSAYDLSYITIPVGRDGKRSRPHIAPAYHAVHLRLLWALYKVTSDPALKETAERWTSYIERKS